MKPIWLFSAVFLPFFASSCRTRNIQKTIEAFVGQTIVLPDNMQPVLNGRGVSNLNLIDATVKLVVWIDSIGCTSCALQHLDPWYDITSYTNPFGDKAKVLFILSPKYSDRNSIDRSTTLFRYPMYIDRECRFPALNPTLPKDPRLHVFLLDHENRVVLVGSPIGNKNLWELYKQQIEHLTAETE